MAKHRDCTICGNPIVLMPSAAERSRRYGEDPSYYLNLFTEHSRCTVKKRTEQAIANIRRHARTGEGAIL